MTACFVIAAELVSEDFTESLCSQLINQESMKEEKQKNQTQRSTEQTAPCLLSTDKQDKKIKPS